MIKHYCDRCRKEIKTGEDVSMIHYTPATLMKAPRDMELCADCTEQFKIWIDGDVQPKRKGRGTR